MKKILITGASSGIGLACAQKLISSNELILCSRSKATLEDVKKKISENNNCIHILKVDVTNSTEVELMFDRLNKENLSPDIVINCAGLALGLENLENGKIADWEEMFNTNVIGLLHITKHALKQMKVQNSGHIINIGSIAGITTYAKGVVYSATKAAVKSISDGLRKEVIENNIKITNIQPGLVKTNFSNVRFKGDTKKAEEAYSGIKPLISDDIANIIEFVIKSPEHVQINEVTVTPLHQATVEQIYRNN